MQAPETPHPIGAAWPTAGLLVAALISGLYWLPLGQVEQAGITSLWAPVSIAAVAGVPLLLPLLRRRRRTATEWRDLALLGLLLGGAYALYSASFMLTDVVRVVLLFYLAPVWGTLLEIFLLRRPLTLQRCASLILGLSGLAVILGADRGLSLAMNAGDALALASGIAWSLGLLVIFSRAERPIGDQIAAQAAGAILVAALVAAIGLAGVPPPSPEQFVAASPWLLTTALLLTIPMWCLSLWASRHLAPARTTLLFMIEVCIGVGSAALLSGDPFGWREAAGTILVVSAALIELKQSPRRPVGSRCEAADLV
jgi:drug/metabolite transporter (DMT)-like permease